MAEIRDKGPRPLDFVRVRYYRSSGQAEYIRGLLNDEKEALMEELGALRVPGHNPQDPKIAEIEGNLRHLINCIRDLEMGLVELVGPSGT